MAIRTVTVGPRISGGAFHGVGFDLDSPLSVGVVGQSQPQALVGGSLQSVKANAADPATGADLIIDVEYSTDDGATWASLFQSDNNNKIVLPAGSSAVHVFSAFAVASVAANTKFRPNVLQVGSANSGGYVSVDVVWS